MGKACKHNWLYVGTDPFNEPTFVCSECGSTKIVKLEKEDTQTPENVSDNVERPTDL